MTKRPEVLVYNRRSKSQQRPSAEPVEPLEPSHTPTELAELDTAIMLLGNRAQGNELRESKRAELVRLVGCYPSVERAKAWKGELRRMRAELIDEGVLERGE